jgi:hypothetical protein
MRNVNNLDLKDLTLKALRFLGAVAILGVGAVHLQQYLGNGYQTVPTIGPLFLLNAIAGAVVGFALLVPYSRWLAERSAAAVVGLLAAGGVAIAAASLLALFISETSSLFGFSEGGYRPIIVLAIAVEAAAIVLLTPVAVHELSRFFSRRFPTTPRWRGNM